MFTIRSSVVPRSISKTEVIQVARSAQEKVLLGIEEPPDRPSLAERIVDTICGGVKKTTKDEIRALSHHTASLHLEMEKSVHERSRVIENTHGEEIYLKQKKISELLRGETLEYGRIGDRAVVGKESYMVHRSAEKICPTGIPLYLPVESPEQLPEVPTERTVPTFSSVDDIGVDNIRAIRNSGTEADEGFLTCEGLLYRIHFGESNLPTVTQIKATEKSERIQMKLFSLWNVYPDHFTLNPLSQPVPSISPAPLPMPPGLPVTAQNTGLVAHQTGTGLVQTPPVPIPRFDTEQQITGGRFEEIRAAGKLISDGTCYRVRFDRQGEPIVLCEDLSPATKGIQLTLFRIWITGQARNALDVLEKLRSDRVLHLPIADTDTELFEIRERLNMNSDWSAQAGLATRAFGDIVDHLQHQINAKKSELEKTFGKIVNNTIPVVKQRSEFQVAQARLADLSERQERLRENIQDLKKVYWQLFQVAGNCTNYDLQKIVLDRIGKLSACAKEYARIKNNSVATTRLNSIMQIQLRFIELCPTIGKLLFDGVPIQLVDESVVLIPVTEAMPKLAELGASLKRVSSDANLPSVKLEVAKRLFEHEQRRINVDMQPKLKFGDELTKTIKGFRGQNGEGLNPETNQSYYTPETFARLITIKHYRNELVNPNSLMTEAELGRICAECENHVEQIKRETTEIALFEPYQMYSPRRNVSGTSYMDYAQWCDDQAARELV